MANANENVKNYKYENSELVEVTINNNGNDLTFSLGGGGSGEPGNFTGLTVSDNGIYTASEEGYDGYDTVEVEIPNANFQDKEVQLTSSYTVTPDTGFDGIGELKVSVPREITNTDIQILSGLPSVQDKSPTSHVQVIAVNEGGTNYSLYSRIGGFQEDTVVAFGDITSGTTGAHLSDIGDGYYSTIVKLPAGEYTFNVLYAQAHYYTITKLVRSVNSFWIHAIVFNKDMTKILALYRNYYYSYKEKSTGYDTFPVDL